MRNFARRAISLLCVLSMLFSMVITSSAQQSGTTISVISQTIEQGSGTEEVEVPIKILNNTGILGMTVSVTFDDELTLVNAVKGEALSSLTFAKSKNLTDVPYNLVWDGEASADTNNGVIATLTFEVPKGTAKDYAINIEASGVYDDNVEPLYPTTVNGKITVEGKIDEPTSETTINVENQTIEQGTGTEDVEVPIKISNNSGILGMTVSVTFDDELTLVNAVKGDALNSLTFAKSKNFTDVPYNLVWDGEASADTNNGVIATLTFTVPKGTVKDYAINIEASGVYDDNVNPLYPTTINGKISVEAGQEEPSSDTTISVESQTVEQGTGNEDVEVPIKISNNSGILGMTVSVTFDDELTLVNAVKGDALSSLTFAKSKNFTDVPYNLVWDGEASADTNNGVIATLTFTVPKGSAKDYSINIAASGVYDDNVNPLYPTAVNGKISVSDNEHNHSYGDWVKDNDNTHSKTCECGDVVTEAHNWDDGEVTTPATHTTTGIKTYTCSECNGTKTEIIPADSDNHTFGEWEKVDDTNHSRECACGETETATHNWNDGEVTTPATHTATGIKTFTCEDCGATKTETIDKTPTHSHGVWTKVDDNTHSKTCECGDVVTEDHNWNDGEVTTEATHTKDGIKTYTCPDCSATKTETIPADADNHSFGAWAKVDDNNHKRECACGEIETKSHNWGEGTITKPATHTEYGVRTYTCPDCNATKTEQVNKTPDHSHGAWVKDNDNTHSKTCACGDVITENHNWNDGEVTTPATHTATGIKTFTCSECNGTKTEIIPADSDNHTFGEWEKVDDTNHSRECACGETETAAHTWDDGEITTPATHTTTGVKTFTCGDCGATKTETIEKTPTHSHGAWVKDNDNTHSKTCACGDVITEDHNWNDGEVTTPATHTATGIKTFTCSECNGTKTEIIPADSDNHTFGEWEKVDDTNHSRECACGETETATHTWDDGEITTPATHTTTGVKTYTCEDCGVTKTETIDKTPTHSHGSWVKDNDTTHSKSCECGDVITENHNWNDGEVTTLATHTTMGIKTYTCGDCGATKTETIDKTPTHSHGVWVKDDNDTHSKTCECGDVITEAHNWDDGEVTTPATHTATGVKTYTCPDCSATKTETIPADADNHSFGAWAKVDDNNHKRECACGEIETKSHNWGEGTITKPATHTEYGVRTYTCPDCNATKTEQVNKTPGHSHGAWVKDDNDTHSKTCACGDVVTEAHNWDDGEVTTPATHTTTGVKTFTCGDCGATKTETIEKTPTHSHGAWVKDNDNTHSKTCACGDVITEDHNWNDGEVTTPATHTATGIKTFTCSECNGTKTEIIPADSDNHTFGEWEKVDDTNHSRECACGETETAAHTWNDGEVTTAATHTTTGVKTFTCGDCGATKTETIDKAPTHSHGAWTRVDDNTHSKSCACGDEITENHNWDAGVVTTQPTYSSTGIKTYTCPDCSATKTETIPVLTHVSSGRGGVTKYTVKYETNGGNVIKSVSVRRNSLLTKPTDPTKEGFEFDGWYIDENLTEIYDFTSKVTKGFTLYAKWTEIEKEPEIIEPDKEQDFVDVSEEDWFDNSVKYVVNNNLMNGVSDKEFAPNAAVTRAMLVTVLYRNEGEPATNKSIPFADVDMSTYYANAVSWAKQNGIVSGVSENTFAPDVNITREQIAAIMHRYAKYKGYDVSVGENTNILSYDDFDSISEYAIASMQYVVGSGLIKGKSETTLNPLDSATRAEIAAILQRFIEANK